MIDRIEKSIWNLICAAFWLALFFCIGAAIGGGAQAVGEMARRAWGG